MVDDDPTVRLLADQVLTDHGFRVVEADDGESGLHAFKENLPDLVLLDVVMPRRDGYSVCTAIRAESIGRHTPILIMTGLDDQAAIQRAYQVGATDFITKPVQWGVLGHRVRYLLRAGKALKDVSTSEANVRGLVNALPDGLCRISAGGHLLDYKPARNPLAVLDHAQGHLGEPYAKIFPVEFNAALDRLLAANRDGSGPRMEDVTFPDGKGENLVLELRASPAAEDWIVLVRDVTERVRSEEQLRKLSTAVEQSPVSVMITTVDGRIDYVNAKFCEVTGYTAVEVRGQTPKVLQSGHTKQEEYDELLQRISAGDTWEGEFRNRRKDGSFYWEHASIAPIVDTRGRVTHYLAVKEDITERKSQEKRIRQLAYCDTLTGLPNRVYFREEATRMLALALRAGGRAAVCMMDLDDFRRVNDTLGHKAGDLLLERVAERVQKCLRTSDLSARMAADDGMSVARLGGDEFALLLSSIGNGEHVGTVARRVLESLNKPFEIEGHELFVGASIGIAVYPQDGEDIDTLLKNADTAMYQAKRQNRGDFHLYSQELHHNALQRLSMEGELRRALEKEEFLLYYQPQFDSHTLQPVGVEALIRWQSQDRGLVPPNLFLPIAEEFGLIGPIGHWVIEEALRQTKVWQAEGLGSLVMGVNLSGRQFRQKDFPKQLNVLLDRSGVDSNLINFELTEGILMQAVDETLRILRVIKERGAKISVDDFGTGYSSLSYLRQFPLDTLKVDKSFVDGLITDVNDAAITAAIVRMAHSLNLEVVAEGVEKDEQLKMLAGLGCDLVQGYLLGRPLPAADLVQHLRTTVHSHEQLAANSLSKIGH